MFRRTVYAKRNQNHEILLALRYIRILAINYYQENGRSFPERSLSFRGIGRRVARPVARADRRSRRAPNDPPAERMPEGSALPPLDERYGAQGVSLLHESDRDPRAVSKVRGSIASSRRSRKKSSRSISISSRSRAIGRRLAAGSSSTARARINYFCRSPANFRTENFIMAPVPKPRSAAFSLQGVLPSQRGVAGRGSLRQVRGDNISFAANWGGQPRAGRRFRRPIPTRASADLTQGEGKTSLRKIPTPRPAATRTSSPTISASTFCATRYHERAYIVKKQRLARSAVGTHAADHAALAFSRNGEKREGPRRRCSACSARCASTGSPTPRRSARSTKRRTSTTTHTIRTLTFGPLNSFPRKRFKQGALEAAIEIEILKSPNTAEDRPTIRQTQRELAATLDELFYNVAAEIDAHGSGRALLYRQLAIAFADAHRPDMNRRIGALLLKQAERYSDLDRRLDTARKFLFPVSKMTKIIWPILPIAFGLAAGNRSRARRIDVDRLAVRRRRVGRALPDPPSLR